MNKVKKFFKYLREYGFINTCKATFYDLGIASPCFKIKYPIQDIDIRVTVKASKSDPLHWLLLERGEIEYYCIKFISSIIKEGAIVFDIGAYVGSYTLLFSKLVGSSGKIVAFEPNPIAFSILNYNLRKNSALNVIPIKMGVSNTIGKVELKTQDFGASTASITRYKGYSKGLKTFTANCTTLDNYCSENGVIPQVIKIDVEGAEAQVIEGAKNIIHFYHPMALIEFHGDLMSAEERINSWKKITEYAKEVIFIDDMANGDSFKFSKKDSIVSNKDKFHFHIWVQY
jgi:FkbM family methyltransferase